MPLPTNSDSDNPTAATYRAPVSYSKILEHMAVAYRLPRSQPYPFIDKESTFSFYPKTTRQDEIISKVMESCLFKSCLSTVAGTIMYAITAFFICSLLFSLSLNSYVPSGYGLGGLVGLFTFGVESPQHHQDPSKVPTVKETMREMKTRLHSQGKAFAFIGGMFAITECTIETVCYFVHDLIWYLNLDFLQSSNHLQLSLFLTTSVYWHNLKF